MHAPAPASNHDFQFFYDGVRRGELLLQRCARCGRLRNPPGPSCPACRSLEWAPTPVSGRGVVFTYTIHYYPPLEHFVCPHAVAVVELDEGVRLVGALQDVPVGEVRIGLPVAVAFTRHDDDRVTFAFRAAALPGEAPTASPGRAP